MRQSRGLGLCFQTLLSMGCPGCREGKQQESPCLPSERICISLEEGNKAGGLSLVLLSCRIFYRSQQSPADTKCWRLWGSSSSWSEAPGSLGMGSGDLAGRFGNGSQEDTDTTHSNCVRLENRDSPMCSPHSCLTGFAHNQACQAFA